MYSALVEQMNEVNNERDLQHLHQLCGYITRIFGANQSITTDADYRSAYIVYDENRHESG